MTPAVSAELPSWPSFVTAYPSQQNAADLFDWLCEVPAEGVVTGTMRLFYDEDRRPQMAADVFGSIQGFDILELGPMEGAHTYQLERLEAGSILAIEAAPKSYLKCLISKEMLDLKARFLLGDFNLYLERERPRFDLVFASGVLYHMIDPIHTLYLIAQAAPRAFFWTHYVEDHSDRAMKPVERHGFRGHYYEYLYQDGTPLRPVAGIYPSAHRMYRSEIIECLKFFGYDRVIVTEDTPDHPGEAAFSLACYNSRLADSASAAGLAPYRKLFAAPVRYLKRRFARKSQC